MQGLESDTSPITVGQMQHLERYSLQNANQQEEASHWRRSECLQSLPDPHAGIRGLRRGSHWTSLQSDWQLPSQHRRTSPVTPVWVKDFSGSLWEATPKKTPIPWSLTVNMCDWWLPTASQETSLHCQQRSQLLLQLERIASLGTASRRPCHSSLLKSLCQSRAAIASLVR